MVIGCMRLTDVTHYEVRYNSDRVTDVVENLACVCCLYGACNTGKDFGLILAVKIETSHPVDGQCGRKFPAICNHCVVMTV